MKRFSLISLLFCSLFFSSCTEYIDNEMFIGTWASVANAKDPALFLHVDENTVTVENGSWDYRPFSFDETWEYFIDKDSVLHLTRYYYDGEDYSSETKTLDLSFSDSYNTLTLWYKPPLGALRKYTFIRRR